MITSRDIGFEYETDSGKKTEICSAVLRALPDWFGIPEAIENYSKEVRDMTFLKIIDKKAGVIGFIAVKLHFDFNAELYVLGLKKEFHDMGIGTRALSLIEENIKKKGIPFMSVKTLSPARESKEYNKTRMFYEKSGFKAFEEFKDLWGPENPCLYMIKKL